MDANIEVPSCFDARGRPGTVSHDGKAAKSVPGRVQPWALISAWQRTGIARSFVICLSVRQPWRPLTQQSAWFLCNSVFSSGRGWATPLLPDEGPGGSQWCCSPVNEPPGGGSFFIVADARETLVRPKKIRRFANNRRSEAKDEIFQSTIFVPRSDRRGGGSNVVG